MKGQGSQEGDYYGKDAKAFHCGGAYNSECIAAFIVAKGKYSFLQSVDQKPQANTSALKRLVNRQFTYAQCRDWVPRQFFLYLLGQGICDNVGSTDCKVSGCPWPKPRERIFSKR